MFMNINLKCEKTLVLKYLVHSTNYVGVWRRPLSPATPPPNLSVPYNQGRRSVIHSVVSVCLLYESALLITVSSCVDFSFPLVNLLAYRPQIRKLNLHHNEKCFLSSQDFIIKNHCIDDGERPTLTGFRFCFRPIEHQLSYIDWHFAFKRLENKTFLKST